MFCFAGVDGQIFGSRVFADDHPCVNVFLWTDEEAAAFLNVVERVCRAKSLFHRYLLDLTESSDLIFERRVFTLEWCLEYFASGLFELVCLTYIQSSCWN